MRITQHLRPIGIIFGAMVLALLFSALPAATAQHVHALLVIMDATREPAAAAGFEVNRQRMEAMLETLNSAGVVVTSETWRAASRSIKPAAIRDWIATRRVAQDDTLFVYYSGAGLAASDREGLASAITGKACRLKIFVTDPCHHFMEVQKEQSKVVGEPSRTRQLLLEHEGFLNVTAVEPKYYAFGDTANGGFFTDALLGSIAEATDTTQDGFLSWEEVRKEAFSRTKNMFADSNATNEYNSLLSEDPLQTTQMPEIYGLVPTRARGPEARARGPEGGEPRVEELDPNATLVEELDPNATLDITSTPPGAAVSIDRKPVGTTPVREHKIDVGGAGSKEVTVLIEHEGYEPKTETLMLGRGKTVPLHTALQKLPPKSVSAILDITSKPSGATVYLDDRQVGTTPLREYQVDTGPNGEKEIRIGIELAGYEIDVQRVVLTGGETLPWHVQLKKLPERIPTLATLDVTSTPAGATVSVNGSRIGNTPLHGYEVDTGPNGQKVVTLRMELEGYESEVRQVTLRGGEPASVTVRLKKRAVRIETKAVLDITSTPRGAAVYLDEQRIGTTPLRGYQVETGARGQKRVNVRIKHLGYKTRNTTLTLNGGQSQPLDVALEKIQRPGKTATLSITSTPSGGTVYLEGKKVGTTPLQGYKVSLGTRDRRTVRVTIGAKGDAVHFPRPKDLKLTQNQHTSWHFQEESVQQPRTRKPVDPGKEVLISAGTFRMGSDKLASKKAEPIHKVSLDAFYIDKYEVTLGEYNHFLMETGHRSLPMWVAEHATSDKHPVVGVSWHDAMAYAEWADKRLPTEAEWEKAARGGLMDMHYPWGNEEPDSSRANFGKETDQLAGVGKYPANAFGLYDMAGNVSEWCLDPWDADFYANSPQENPFAGRKGRDETIRHPETVKGLRMIRGGSSIDTAGAVHVAARHYVDAAARKTNIGFRCARDAPP